MNRYKLLSHPALLLACRLLLGGVFIVAALPKITAPESFATSVEAYEMLPLAVVNLAAILIPWIELVCGVFLIGGVYLRPGSALLGFLLALFVVAITVAVLRGLNINCGCFGEGGGSPVGWNKVIEDLALMIPAWLLFRSGSADGPSGKA